MSKLRVLHIALNAPNEPNHGIEKGFIYNDVSYIQIDWISIKNSNGIEFLQEHIIAVVNEFMPNIVFMQIQGAGIIYEATAQEISKESFVVNWTGDVREDVEWYKKLAPFVDLTLFTNITDINKMKGAGVTNVDYLQIGYDHDIYRKLTRKVAYPKVVFLGNNYTHRKPNFPLTQERIDMVKFLRKEFNSSFQVYGAGWEGTQKLLPNEEVVCYNSCKIGINQNHFDYERFSSDRILRIMASGAMCLSKYYKGIELEFKIGEHLDVWYDFNELKEKINYYLKNENKRLGIAEAGRHLVTTKYNWTERVKQLFKVSKKHDLKKKLATNNKWVNNIPTVTKFKKYSQWFEEGYIGFILSQIGNYNHFIVDLGAANSNVSNTRYFMEIGYNGLLIDADNEGNPEIKQDWITKENIISILEKYNCPKEFDLLSIDIDGNDYYVLKEVLSVYSPRLIVAEINGKFELNESVAITYNPLHSWIEDDYYGGSIGAFIKLAKETNYSVVFQNGSINAFLVRNDLIEGGASPDLNYVPIIAHKHNDYAVWQQI